MRTKSTLAAAMGFFLAALPALAHHSMSAKYDTNQSIVLQGTVQKITWNNPHVHLFLQAPDKGVPDASWEFEMGSPSLLLQNGWKLGTFRQGDHVIVTAYPARDGSRLGYASKVSLSSH
jgi:uncharacterized protein DUF6152